MATISITTDCDKPLESTTHEEVEGGLTILDWASEREENFHTTPWLCILYRDGDYFYPLHTEWIEVEIHGNDKILFFHHVGTPVQIIIAVVVVIAAVLATLLIQPPSIEDQNQPDPVFSVDGRRNQARLNSPIEDAYGRNKLWVSYISSPYTRFEGNNKQTLYQNFCLGHGVFDIEKVMLDDTDADNFPEVEYVFDDTGGFSNNVSTCHEVSSLNLLGTNQDDYIQYIGPFSINPPNTIVNQIEIDWSMDGCFQTSDEGDLRHAKVEVTWEYREIDRDGAAIGVWADLYVLNQAFKTNQPIRRSISNAVPDGRYEVRCSRLDKSHKATNGKDDIIWVAAKGYLGNTDEPVGLTTLSIKTRATTNTVKNKVNVLCTRKIPVWDGAAWSAPVASRNPIWIAVSILKAARGAGLTDAQLDLDQLKITADLADANDETFDWVFEQKSTVWEAVRACCFVCRSTPTLEGSRMSAVRDAPKVIPTQLFNSNNIVKGTLKQQRKMFDLDGFNGLEVEYLDHDTWRDETTLCTLPNQSGTRPKKFKMRGVTNRTSATILGHYLWASEFHNRKTIEFVTSHAGFISTYGDLVKVQLDLHGQGGAVEAIELSHTLTLTEPPEFSPGDHQITLRNKTGGVYGPFLVEAVADEPYKVKLVSGILDETSIPISDTHEPPHYVFGKVNEDGILCRITKVQPQGLDSIKISVVVEDAERFQYDGITPPPIVYPLLDPFPELPAASNLFQSESGGTITATWDTAIDPAADTYKVSISEDGIAYTDEQVTALLTADFANPSYIDEGVFLQVIATNADGDGLPQTLFSIPKSPISLVDGVTNTLVDGEGNRLTSSI